MIATRALGCLLVAFAAACSTRRATPSKRDLPPAVMPSASTSTSATAAAPVAPSASCTQLEAPRLDPAALKPGPAPQALSSRPGLWLADERSALLSASPEASWAEGPISADTPNGATRAVALARLPKALRAWLGRPVKVLGVNGAVCETRLQRFLIHAQITPDPRTAEHWEGCADGPSLTPEAIAAEVWRVSAQAGRSLIAEFSAPCKGALFAVDPDLPAPTIAAPQPASAEVGAGAMAAFRQLPEYARIQTRFHAENPGVSGSWDDREAHSSISTLTLAGRTPLVVVSVEVGTGCKGFSGALSALWAGGGPAVALTAIDDRRLTPSAIVELEGPGAAAVVLLGPDGPFAARSLLRPKRNAGAVDVTRYERVFLSSVPFFPGPC